MTEKRKIYTELSKNEPMIVKFNQNNQKTETGVKRSAHQTGSKMTDWQESGKRLATF